MQKTTLERKFNARKLDLKYNDIWNRGIHLFTIDDKNRDFQYSIFYIDLLFAEVIYNKLTGDIITINSFSDKAKMIYYMTEDFN
ncbi:hypothetical protein D1816_03500 [Aquimarina sp. AD10]|uniref:Uncharacterized protein n=1 Tax=Aquimarina aggregata TaxID=1642818 RepID=A0A162CXI1_9FLAO|nr:MULTISPECIES: hypothetical protein [Aquimarina]AXT59454.1 hypothetical protein D1816_03500 [Aquimarina sp. AD10]KZS42549.1 hypothetical protein AWE51_03650 [Aquimarina aggregata]RKN00355.1 hypothetical protein D7033_08330 [Aquimarina sp. AD10]